MRCAVNRGETQGYLAHEIGDHAMEREAVVEAARGEVLEIGPVQKSNFTVRALNRRADLLRAIDASSARWRHWWCRCLARVTATERVAPDSLVDFRTASTS